MGFPAFGAFLGGASEARNLQLGLWAFLGVFFRASVSGFGSLGLATLGTTHNKDLD